MHTCQVSKGAYRIPERLGFRHMHIYYIYITNHTKWTHFGAVSATVGVTLLHIIKNISN